MIALTTRRSYRRNTELFGENEPADYLYKVVSGGVRTYKILNAPTSTDRGQAH
jgi:CRP/FNR family transcriptional regulator, nitrogen fixation regulation protein